MVFSSLTFLYVFLPLTVGLYFLCKNRVYRNTVLLIFSLLFYSWGEPKMLLVMLAVSLAAYVGGMLIELFHQRGQMRYKKIAFIVTTIIIAGNLFVFKYLNFASDNIGALLNLEFDIKAIALPIGISFYTFQILSYVIDLYRRKVAVQRNYFYLTLYVTFFPQLIAGPIVRYETIEKEIRVRDENADEFAQGLKRFVRGLAKKAVIANSVSSIPLIVYSGDAAIFGSVMYWLAAIGYALQIYFDFSGYSDMGIGLGRMFGFHFTENFNYPYIATSVTDFWRRWHISLSTWFRDYIYIPMGGNRVKKCRFIFNILFVWCLTGLWHGAEWNFVLWGVYYGVLLLLEKLFFKKLLDRLPKVAGWAYTMFFVLIGWVVFNLTDMEAIRNAINVMFSFTPTDIEAVISNNSDILTAAIYIPMGILCMLPWKDKIKLPQNSFGTALSGAIHTVIFVISIVYVISSSYNPFIYFRF